jgi:starvation-inducible DNA-binding protein
MTDITRTVPQGSVDPDVAAGVAQFLSQIVTDMTALSVNGKQAHWHVRGIAFVAVHELIDVVVDHAREWADLAAERVVALGLPVDGRIETVAAKTVIPPTSPGFNQIDVTIAELVASSQDVAIEISRGLEKDRWFLAAHVAG